MPEPMKKRVAVIGGGLAGMAAAHRLIELAAERDAPTEITLFEAAPQLGGAVDTDERDGFLVERGADMFITDKPWATALCERLGIADRLIGTHQRHRHSLVLRDGKPEPVPEGFMLMAPSAMAPFLMSPILSPAGKLRAAADLVLPKGNGADESLAAFVRRRFGSEMLDRLVQPLVGGIYTGDPERLSLRATLPRFIDMERAHRSLIVASVKKRIAAGAQRGESGARYGMFVSFPRGMRELVEALSARVAAGAAIQTRTEVTELSRFKQGYVIGAGRSRYMVDAVIVALPAWRAAALLSPVAAPAAELLAEIPYASTAVVVSGHRFADVAHPLNAFGLVVPAIEGREVLAVSFASRKFDGRAPAGSVLMRTFIGGVLQGYLYERDDDELVEIARRELADILGVRGIPHFTQVSRHGRAMPQYEVGHLERLERLEGALQAEPGLALAGNAYRGVGIPDVIHSGEQAAEKVFAGLDAR